MKLSIKILLAAILLTGTYTFAKPGATKKLIASDITDRHLSGFNAVHVGGSFDVYITQGSGESVKVEAPADMMDRLVTEVKDGVLKIYNKQHNEGWNWGELWGNHKKVRVYVTARDLNSIDISGSGNIFFKDGITTNSLKLKISGSGDILGKMDVKILESHISGSGDMKLTGRAENSTVTVVGSGDFIARDLLTANSQVHISGSGDAVINASAKVDASVNGSGDIRYTGNATNVSKRKSGSGDISKY